MAAGRDSLPLSGRVVALARPEERMESWSAALEEAGAEVLKVPAIAMMPPEDTGPLDEALRRLSDSGCYDWLVFTSPSALKYTIDRCDALGLDRAMFQRCRVAAVGRSTAAAIEEASIVVSRIPERQDAEGLLGCFSAEELGGVPILMPRAASGRDTFPTGARALGASVDVVAAYRTVATPSRVRPLRERLKLGRVDALVLGSPSQVRSVSEGLGVDLPLLFDIVVACMGPTTAMAARELGLAPRIPRCPEPSAMVDLLVTELSGDRGEKGSAFD